MVGNLTQKELEVKQIYIHGEQNSYAVAWQKINTKVINQT